MSAHLSWAGSRLRLPAKCPTLVPLTTSYTSCMASACFPLAQQEFKDGAPAPGRSTVYTSGPAGPGPSPKPRPSEAALKLALPFVPKPVPALLYLHPVAPVFKSVVAKFGGKWPRHDEDMGSQSQGAQSCKVKGCSGCHLPWSGCLCRPARVAGCGGECGHHLHQPLTPHMVAHTSLSRISGKVGA